MPIDNISPDVSVIMPMHNAEAYVLQAIDSILKQSYTALEIIVIDDCSTDNCAALIKSVQAKDKRLKLLAGSGQGISAAKNMGLSHAQGKVILFCDADDYFSPDRVADQVAWLTRHPEAGAVCGSYTMVDSGGNNAVMLDTGNEECEITGELRSGKTRTHLCTFAIRASLITTSNHFRAFFVSAEDIDFQLRLTDVCRVFYVPVKNYFYRLHDSSITHQQATNTRQFYEQTARHLSQQRVRYGTDDLEKGIIPAIPENILNATKSNIQLQGLLIGNSWQLLAQGKRSQAICKGFQALKVDLTSLMPWKSLIMLIFKSLTKMP